MNKLYTHKPIKYGFTVLCPTENIYLIKNTINSIKLNYPDTKYNCIFPPNISKDLIKEISKFCKTYISEEASAISLMNEGFNNLFPDWNFVIRSGFWIKPELPRKYSFYIENDKDILYPFVRKKSSFIEGSAFGFLIHKKTSKDLGLFSKEETFENSKILWVNKALEEKCKFKAIYGLNFC